MESNESLFSGERAFKYDAFFSTDYGKKVFLLEKALMLYCLENLRVSSVLEVGCGTFVWGDFWKEILKAEFIVGLDISYDMLKIAKSKGFKRLILGSAENLPFKEKSFDVVAFITSLEFVKDKEAALMEALKVAKRYLIVGYLNRKSLLAFKRKIKSLLWRTVYKEAHFLTEKEVKRLIEGNAKKLGKSVDLIRKGTTLNFSTEKFVSFKLENFLGFGFPFGGFGFLVFEVS